MTQALAPADRQKKEIEATISAITSSQPELKDRINMAAIWSYLQMPDTSFGWTSNAVMPQNVKLMAIAAHLQVGAKPGYGHIYFLGNKLYQSADFVRSKSNSDSNWKLKGTPKFVALTNEEKEMYGIEQGDMVCKYIAEVEHNGETFEGEGLGVIGKEEIAYRSASGKPKAGLGSKKDKAMTLRTRAQRDFLNRFYPTHGVPVGPDVSEEPQIVEEKFEEQIKLAKTESTPEELEQTREKIKVEAAQVVEAEDMTEALESLNVLIEQAKEKKIKQKDLWQVVGCKTKSEFLKYPLAEFMDALEVIDDFINSQEQEQEKSEPVNVHVESAQKRYAEQIRLVEEKGGSPMLILGFNHLNLIGSTDVKALSEASAKLVAYLNEVDDDPFEGLIDDEPKKQKPDLKVYKYIDRLKTTDIQSKAILDLLDKLYNCILKDGDEHTIVPATRKENVAELEKLLSDRAAL